MAPPGAGGRAPRRRCRRAVGGRAVRRAVVSRRRAPAPVDAQRQPLLVETVTQGSRT